MLDFHIDYLRQARCTLQMPLLDLKGTLHTTVVTNTYGVAGLSARTEHNKNNACVPGAVVFFPPHGSRSCTLFFDKQIFVVIYQLFQTPLVVFVAGQFLLQFALFPYASTPATAA